jgi:hypothetical protein
MVLFLFLSHLGLGIAFTLAVVSREAGLKFFRFNAALAAILIAGALASAPTLQAAGAQTALARWAFASLVASEGFIVFFWATAGRALSRWRGAVLAAAVSAGMLAIVLQALAVNADMSIPVRLLTVASFVSSAALLGGSCTAMILGHWYLVIPSLEIRHLQSIVKVHIASMIARVVVVGVAVAVGLALWGAGPVAHDGSVAMSGSFRRYVTSIEGVFFWQRVLFGLAGPAVLSYLTWQTAKIRSTQSATGILYVDFFTVIVGEALAKYVLLATRVPV